MTYARAALAATRGETVEPKPTPRKPIDYPVATVSASIKLTLQWLASLEKPFPFGTIVSGYQGKKSVVWEVYSSAEKRVEADPDAQSIGIYDLGSECTCLGFNANGDIVTWEKRTGPDYSYRRVLFVRTVSPENLSIEETVHLMAGLLKLRKRIASL